MSRFATSDTQDPEDVTVKVDEVGGAVRVPEKDPEIFKPLSKLYDPVSETSEPMKAVYSTLSDASSKVWELERRICCNGIADLEGNLNRVKG